MNGLRQRAALSRLASHHPGIGPHMPDTFPRILTTWLVALLLGGCAGVRHGSAPADQQYGFEEVWRSPHAALENYRQVKLAPVEVVLSRDIVSTQTGTRMGMADSAAERLRTEIAALMVERLTAALGDRGITPVDESGAGTLLLKVKLEHVYLSPAFHDTPQRTATFTRQTARATYGLVVEDAASGAELAQVRDRAASRDDVELRRRHALEARDDLDRILSRWAWATARLLSD
ncbi:MAG TPA: DUF3313 family protein [Xanthomonadaceae bacterium]|nr:DUF3313 family protein [Xanthomonadaceae bacterium]